MNQRLGRQQWIDAGLRALASQGIDAVRVERLAEALGVTKGSFYWHFKNRGALLEALLETWQARATNAIIDQVEAKGGDAVARLQTLFTIVSEADGRLDREIRGWAAQDEIARRALDHVDRRRLGYLETLFLVIGFTAAEAVARARLVYYALIGEFMTGQITGRDQRLTERLDIVLPMLVRKG
jgi:AcrR family transcriptional regulator